MVAAWFRAHDTGESLRIVVPGAQPVRVMSAVAAFVHDAGARLVQVLFPLHTALFLQSGWTDRAWADLLRTGPWNAYDSRDRVLLACDGERAALHVALGRRDAHARYTRLKELLTAQ